MRTYRKYSPGAPAVHYALTHAGLGRAYTGPRCDGAGQPLSVPRLRFGTLINSTRPLADLPGKKYRPAGFYLRKNIRFGDVLVDWKEMISSAPREIGA